MPSSFGPSPLDRLIGWINPHAGLTRYFARQRLARAYEAASPRDPWKPRRGGASANADHMADATAIRTKARALVQNVPYIRAGIDGLVSATIGTGIMPRGTGPEAATVNRLFAEWATVCDADGRRDYHGIVAGAYRAMEQDGEVLVRLRPRRPSDGLPVPLQMQLLEIDWLDSGRTGTEGGNQVVNGIEYDALGTVVAYWLWDTHPGDTTLRRGLRASSHRIEASKIIHLFAPERPGQGRGFTRLASVIARVRDLQLYEDAELARKNLETRLSVIASGDVASMANPAALDGTADTANARATGDLGQLASGSITEAPPGVNLTVIEPKAAGGYVEYVKHQLHLIATGLGVPYEMLAGDMTEVNYSSARVRLLDFRRGVDQMRWLVLVPHLLSRIHAAFIDAAVLGGVLRTRDLAVDYTTPKWEYVNPEQDVKADIAEISAGLASVSEKLRQRGYKPEEVFAEISSDFAELKRLGVLDILLFKEKGKPLDETEVAKVARTEAARGLRDVSRALDRIDARLFTIEQRPAALAAPVFNVTTPAPEVRVDNHITPTPVHFDVQPAAVQLHMPARKTTGTVERDTLGRVVRTEQIDRDL